jgi:hypothetical protein
MVTCISSAYEATNYSVSILPELWLTRMVEMLFIHTYYLSPVDATIIGTPWRRLYLLIFEKKGFDSCCLLVYSIHPAMGD